MPTLTEPFYLLCRYVLIGPVLRVIGRPKVIGCTNIPRQGPAILAANHLAVLDSFYLTYAARRRVTFLAKHEYFEGRGFVGRLQRQFFRAMGQIPVDRQGGNSATSALDAATSIVREGGVWGIHPEGTRSPDGRLYRGKTGAARVAHTTGTPLIPVAITGTRSDGTTPWWRRRVVIEILEPIDPRTFSDEPNAVRIATDALMSAISARTGQDYVNQYARMWEKSA